MHFPSKPFSYPLALARLSFCNPELFTQFPNFASRREIRNSRGRSENTIQRDSCSLEIIHPASKEEIVERRKRAIPVRRGVNETIRGLFIPFGAFRRATSPCSSFSIDVFLFCREDGHPLEPCVARVWTARRHLGILLSLHAARYPYGGFSLGDGLGDGLVLLWLLLFSRIALSGVRAT